MEFNNLYFLCVFLPAALGFYWLTPKKLKPLSLFLASFLFYAHFSLKNAAAVFAYALSLYFCAWLRRHLRGWFASLFTACSVLWALLPLLYCKYAAFFWEQGRALFPDLFAGNPVLFRAPIALSFITFTGLSYLIDQARACRASREACGAADADLAAGLREFGNERKKTAAEFATEDSSATEVSAVPRRPSLLAGSASLLSYLNYFFFFPKLISGPLARFGEVARPSSLRGAERFSYGIARFVFGLAKKMLLAHYLGRFVDSVWMQLNYSVDAPTAWLAALAYCFQIYFDFSGYSDMAIGLAAMFGVDLGENFHFPYLSASVGEFWRRWHISLGAWFRDYLYFPLGGSRRGNVYLNLLIVFFCTGLWHGASWLFILWGLWHGFWRVVEKLIEKRRFYQCIPRLAKQGFTFILVFFSWIPFRAPDWASFEKFVKVMFGWIQPAEENYYFAWPYFYRAETLVILAAALLLALLPARFHLPLCLREEASLSFGKRTVLTLVLAILFLLSLMTIFAAGNTPFIYFQF